ncbi:MAG: PAS domain-containing protein [Desulfobacteraceae bacterium]|jgi:PAS domain S-box-containing protein
MGKKATYEELLLHVEKLKRKIEEEKKAREKLEYLLLRYKGIFNNTENCVAIFRPEKGGRNFRFVDFNRAAESVDNITKKKVRNHLLLDVFPNMKKFGLLDCLRNVLKTNRPKHLTASFYKDDRVQGWREYYIFKLSIREVAVVYRDITYMVNAETALKQSQRKYKNFYQLLKLMIDNIPDAIWAKDLNDCFLFVNQTMCDKVLQCKDMQEALGHPIGYFAQRQRDWGYSNTFGEMSGDSDKVIQREKKPGRFLEDGLVRNKYLALDVYKAPFLDEDGKIIGIVGSGRDITKEKEIDKALEESENRFTTFMGHFPGVVFLCNDSLELIYVNPHMREVLGEQAQVGRSLNELFNQKNSINSTLDCLRALTQGVQESNETFTDCKGNIRTYRMMKFPIYRSGESTILGGIGVDITSLIEAEEALCLAHKNMDKS